MDLETGKRYVCPECGCEVLCTKAGVASVGPLECCVPMEIKLPPPLPSSD